MQRNIATKNFEQIFYSHLPHAIRRTVRAVSREYGSKRRREDFGSRRRRISAADAVLHMRLYQRHGEIDDEVLRAACQYLASLLGEPDDEPVATIRDQLLLKRPAHV